MADPLSVAAGVIGIAVPALHGARLLLNDLDRILDAPAAIARLKVDVDFVHTSLGWLKDVDEATWVALGPAIIDGSKATMESCGAACEAIRGDIQRWTKRSKGNKLAWLDRVNVGFFKEHQLQAFSTQLQTYKLTLNSVMGTATLYSSIRNARMTEELRRDIGLQHGRIEAASSSTMNEVAVVERALAEVRIGPADGSTEPGHDDIDDDRDATVMSLEELATALRQAQSLLAELSSRSREDEVAKATERGDRTSISFGDNNHGVQAGISHGSITWNSK